MSKRERERESALNEWVRECTSTYVVNMDERERELQYCAVAGSKSSYTYAQSSLVWKS